MKSASSLYRKVLRESLRGPGSLAAQATTASTSTFSTAATATAAGASVEGMVSLRTRMSELLLLWRASLRGPAAGPLGSGPQGSMATVARLASQRGGAASAGGFGARRGMSTAAERRGVQWGSSFLGTFGGRALLSKMFPIGAAVAAAAVAGTSGGKEAEAEIAVAHMDKDDPTAAEWGWLGLLLPLFKRLMWLLDTLFHEFRLAARALFLGLLFSPIVVSAPFALNYGWRRDDWVVLLRWTLEQAGPAFIKWGQWAASRPDLLPRDVCDSLKQLHSNAPSHSFRHTRAEIEEAFGRPLERLFSSIDEEPVASGSIAQVHEAVLSEEGARGTGMKPGSRVAVKVRHPGVNAVMERDFALMARFASISRHLPLLSDLRLDESVRQFGAPMREQLDLAAEARNLSRFNKNFKGWRGRVSFPQPLHPLVSPGVLVETFEEGQAIDRIVESKDNSFVLRNQIAIAGMNSYFKMLLHDNLVHADLHPGNILVRLRRPEDTLWGRVRAAVGLSGGAPSPHLVLLDVGMIAELTRKDLNNVREFFTSLTRLDGERMGWAMLKMSDNQTCPNPTVFVKEIRECFGSFTEKDLSDRAGYVFGELMDVIRRNHVDLDGRVSTVVVTALVLEGWSSKLDPDLKILDTIREMLPMEWGTRMGRTVDRMVQRWSGALSLF